MKQPRAGTSRPGRTCSELTRWPSASAAALGSRDGEDRLGGRQAASIATFHRARVKSSVTEAKPQTQRHSAASVCTVG